MGPSGQEDVDLDDATLLRNVAQRERAPDVAKRAQAVFYQRHVRFLYGVILRQRSSMLAAAGTGAEDLVQETFHRAFDRAATFDATGIDDADRLSRRARAWLGRIAQNLLLDHIGRRHEVAASDMLERMEEPPPPSDPEGKRNASPQLELLQSALSRLSEREQDVLRVSAMYLRAGEHQRLPNAASAELAKRWNTTNQNIRAIRMRAMKKIRAELARGERTP